MSTTNFITDGAHLEGDSPSLANKGNSTILDMSMELTDVLFEYFGRTFTARELVQLKCVSKVWKMLVCDNMAITTRARVEDNTKDWYFPLRFHKQSFGRRRWLCWELWTWCGIHHSSKEIHRLPSLPCFHSPPSQHVDIFLGTRNMAHLFKFDLDCLVASSGGLLLFTNKLDFNGSSFTNWRPLVVCNPLTKTWRMLPAANCKNLRLSLLEGLWKSNCVRSHLVVDEKKNSYKVILTFRNSLYVYKSTSNSWTSQAFHEPVPWGLKTPRPHSSRPYNHFFDVASAIVDGKLYYAYLEMDRPIRLHDRDIDIRTHGHVRVFEIDEDEGTWKPPIRYALSTFFPSSLENPDCDYGLGISSYAMKIVECMGDKYAIIPARFYTDNEIIEDEIVDDYDYIESILGIDQDVTNETMLAFDLNDDGKRDYTLPLQFYVLKLGGDGLAVGQILTQVPRSHALDGWFDHEDFHFDPWNPCKGASNGVGWYRCCARGSVIWVAWEKFLVQYDVISGQSKTKTFSHGDWCREQPDLSYRPSFHMKP